MADNTLSYFMRNVIAMLICLSFAHYGWCQNEPSMPEKCYQQLLDSAISSGHKWEFVYEAPLSKSVISRYSISYFKKYFSDREGRVDSSKYKFDIDSTIYYELLSNSMVVDNTPWTKSELNRCILIKDMNDRIGKQIPIETNRSKREINYYKQVIKEFNRTNPENRFISRYARPVFDKRKEYALIQFMSGTHLDEIHNSSGAGVIIMHIENGDWRELFRIVTLH